MLQKEFKYYLENQKRLSEEYPDKFLTICNNEIAIVSNTYEQAYVNSLKKHKLGSFLIQKAGEGEENYTVSIGVNAIFQ